MRDNFSDKNNDGMISVDEIIAEIKGVAEGASDPAVTETPPEDFAWPGEHKPAEYIHEAEQTTDELPEPEESKPKRPGAAEKPEAPEKPGELTDKGESDTKSFEQPEKKRGEGFETIGFPGRREREQMKKPEEEKEPEEKGSARRIISFIGRRGAGRGEETASFHTDGPLSAEDEYEDEEYERDTLSYDFINVISDDPAKAAKRISSRMAGISGAIMAVAVMAAAAAYLTFGESLGLPWPGPLEEAYIRAGLLTALTLVAAVMCRDVTAAGLWRLLKLRPTLDTLTAFAAGCSIVHGMLVTIGISEGRPMGFVTLMTYFFAMLAKRRRAACLQGAYARVAASADPAAVKVVGGKKFRTAVKTHFRAAPEVEDMAGLDMTERSSLAFAPAALAGTVALAAAAAFGGDGDGGIMWPLAVISSMTAPCALLMASAAPMSRISKRLFASGCTLLNYRAAVRLSRTKRVAVVDSDLFPLGSVHIAGMKIIAGMEQTVCAAEAVMRDVGGGVAKAFRDHIIEHGMAPRKAFNVKYYQGGGMSAQVRDDYVLMGNADFLSNMGVNVKEGLDGRNALFMAINSAEAGIFTLKYDVRPQPYAALNILGRLGVTTDMAVRDFSISEAMIARQFGVRESLLNIPPLESKELFWDSKLAYDEPICAVLPRDSFSTMAEAVGGAKRLVRAARINTFCGYACALIGMGVMYFLSALGKTDLASPGNIALYMLVWYLPVWFVSSFMTNY